MRARALGSRLAVGAILAATAIFVGRGALAQKADAGAPKRAGADAGAQGDAAQPNAGDAGAAADPTGDGGVASDAGDVDAGEVDGGDGGAAEVTCIERLPPGSKRPAIHELFPARGVSGWASELLVTITHGKGETVLPEGLKVSQESAVARILEKVHFAIPDPAGGVVTQIRTQPGGPGQSITTLVIPVVPLPAKGGRSTLVLPGLPLSIARANNEYITICTEPHTIVVDDPIANELDPKVKPNAPPRRQREDWALARQLGIGLLIGAILGLAGGLFYRWWKRRPQIVIAPPKPIPWLVALAELERIRESSLLEQDRNGEYFDRVSDTIRIYLGARYGFDTLGDGWSGLETTTSEMRDLLKRVRPPVAELPAISAFLDECDLVKFARMLPTREECLAALRQGESIVRKTIPVIVMTSDTEQGPRPPESARARRKEAPR